MLKSRISLTNEYRKDTLEMIFKDIVNSAQPSAFYITTSVPVATEGQPGEIRIFNSGGVFKIYVKIDGGIGWKSATLT